MPVFLSSTGRVSEILQHSNHLTRLNISICIGDDYFDIELSCKHAQHKVIESLKEGEKLGREDYVYFTGSWYMTEDEGMCVLARDLIPFRFGLCTNSCTTVAGVATIQESHKMIVEHSDSDGNSDLENQLSDDFFHIHNGNRKYSVNSLNHGVELMEVRVDVRQALLPKSNGHFDFPLSLIVDVFNDTRSENIQSDFIPGKLVYFTGELVRFNDVDGILYVDVVEIEILN